MTCLHSAGSLLGEGLVRGLVRKHEQASFTTSTCACHNTHSRICNSNASHHKRLAKAKAVTSPFHSFILHCLLLDVYVIHN